MYNTIEEREWDVYHYKDGILHLDISRTTLENYEKYGVILRFDNSKIPYVIVRPRDAHDDYQNEHFWGFDMKVFDGDLFILSEDEKQVKIVSRQEYSIGDINILSFAIEASMHIYEHIGNPELSCRISVSLCGPPGVPGTLGYDEQTESCVKS